MSFTFIVTHIEKIAQPTYPHHCLISIFFKAYITLFNWSIFQKYICNLTWLIYHNTFTISAIILNKLIRSKNFKNLLTTMLRVLKTKIYGLLLCIHCPLQRFQKPYFEVLNFLDRHFVSISTLLFTFHTIIVHCLEFGHSLHLKKHLIHKQEWGQKRCGLFLYLIRFWFFNVFLLMMCSNNKSLFSQLYSSGCRSWIWLSFSNYYNFC